MEYCGIGNNNFKKIETDIENTQMKFFNFCEILCEQTEKLQK